MMRRRLRRNTKRRHRPRAIDLFSGCGGLTEGLKQAGFKVVGAVEIDKLAVASYRANHRRVTVWQKNIRKLTAKSVMELLELAPGKLDLLAGCPPCQGFSTLRTQNGAKRNRDERNGLVREMLRFARVFLPKAVMMENVPGLELRKPFSDFCRGLEKIGYKVRWDVKDAARYGVPQRRRRLILLAGRGFDIPFAAEADVQLTVRETIEGLPKAGLSRDPIHDLPEKRRKDVLERIRSVPKDGGSRRDLPPALQLGCHKRCDGFKDIYGRMTWDDVAPTITSGCFNPSKGRFLHPSKNRAITMREAALLQGFPPKYKFTKKAGKQAIAAMIGNALPPEFIRRHAEVIRASAKNALPLKRCKGGECR